MPELMKGHKWSEYKHKMTYPCRVEAKVDEIRVHVIVSYPSGYHSSPDVLFLSYAGKPLANMDRFASGFAELSRVTGYREFDCGFEVNDNFNDSYRWVRSTKGLPDDLQTAKYKFMLYDIPFHGLVPFTSRMVERHFVVEQAANFCAFTVEVPEYVIAHNEEEVEAAFQYFISKGYEGAMPKSMEHVYQRGKRTYGWLKMKPEEDADGVIVGITEAVSEDGTPLGRAGSITIRVEDGSTASPHGIEHELGRDMWLNQDKYLNKWCEFRYMERDRKGGYRHPVFHRLREEKQ